MAEAPQLQMRGLETRSTTRFNGRAPDSSLMCMDSIFIWIRMYTLQILRTVTQSLSKNTQGTDQHQTESSRMYMTSRRV